MDMECKDMKGWLYILNSPSGDSDVHESVGTRELLHINKHRPTYIYIYIHIHMYVYEVYMYIYTSENVWIKYSLNNTPHPLLVKLFFLHCLDHLP
jgi:hypothetical protein